MSVFFGTIDGPDAKLQWIEAPLSPLEQGTVGHSEMIQFENGRVKMVGGLNTSRRYDMSFVGHSFKQHDIDEVLAYRDGIYGPGPFYFVNPAIEDKNLFRRDWADPSLIERGYPNFSKLKPMFGDSPSAAKANKFSGRYTVWELGGQPLNTPLSRYHTIIIPPDKTLHIGVTALYEGGAVLAVPYNTSLEPQPAVQLAALAPNSATRYNTSFDGDDYSAVRIYFALVNGGDLFRLTLYGMDAAYSALGAAAPAGSEHRPGRGVLGLNFDRSDLTYTYTSVYNNLRNFSTTLYEVE